MIDVVEGPVAVLQDVGGAPATVSTRYAEPAKLPVPGTPVSWSHATFVAPFGDARDYTVMIKISLIFKFGGESKYWEFQLTEVLENVVPSLVVWNGSSLNLGSRPAVVLTKKWLRRTGSCVAKVLRRAVA